MWRALMRLNLYGCEAVWHKLKNRQKCIFCVFRPFLSLFRTVSQPYRLSHINALDVRFSFRFPTIFNPIARRQIWTRLLSRWLLLMRNVWRQIKKNCVNNFPLLKNTKNAFLELNDLFQDSLTTTYMYMLNHIRALLEMTWLY